MGWLVKGITAHTELTDKEVGGVIDHADGSVTLAKLGNDISVPRTLVWHLGGNVVEGNEQGPTFRLKRAATVVNVDLHVKTAPVGAALIVDIKKDGVSLFTVLPEIDAGSTTEDGNHVFADTALGAGSEIRADVIQVGTTTAGADLTIQLHIRETLM